MKSLAKLTKGVIIVAMSTLIGSAPVLAGTFVYVSNADEPGRVVTLMAPTGGVLSGQAVQVGALFGIATFDAIGGADVEVALEGIWELPKAAVAIAQGAPVFWDAAAGNVAADIGTSNALIGGATEARSTSDLTIRVRLNGDSVWGAARDESQSSFEPF